MPAEIDMAHEDLGRSEHVEGSSDRSFGFVFAGVFFLISAWPLLHGQGLRWWAFGAAVAFALIAVIRPKLLAGPNRLWAKLGVLLGKLVSPIALGILFYGAVLPVGVAMRLTGKDPMRRKRDANAPSYWIPRDPPGPPPDSMRNLF